MPSHIERDKSRPSPEVFALCLLLASSLQIIETLLPKIPIFPWLRFGLAYLVILPFLIRFGVKQTLLLFICRNLMTLLYGVQIFSSFVISSIAGVFTLFVVGSAGLYLYNRNLTGLFGLSVIMALSFNLAQLTIVYFLFIQHSGFLFQVTPILIWSLVSGGLIAFLIYKGRAGSSQMLEPSEDFRLFESDFPSAMFSTKKLVYVGLSVAGFILILIVSSVIGQLALCVALLIVTRLRAIKTCLLAWPFFAFIAWFHLFNTDGVYIFRDWITREGLQAFFLYALRTINLIFCGQLIARFVPVLLSRWKDNAAFKGMVFAMPLLPALFGISISLGKTFFRTLKSREFHDLLAPIVVRLKAELKKVSV